MGRPADEVNSVIQQLRISPKLEEDLKWFVTRLNAKTAGATFSRTEAIRVLLARGIMKEREEAKLEKRGGRR